METKLFQRAGTIYWEPKSESDINALTTSGNYSCQVANALSIIFVVSQSGKCGTAIRGRGLLTWSDMFRLAPGSTGPTARDLASRRTDAWEDGWATPLEKVSVLYKLIYFWSIHAISYFRNVVRSFNTDKLVHICLALALVISRLTIKDGNYSCHSSIAYSKYRLDVTFCWKLFQKSSISILGHPPWGWWVGLRSAFNANIRLCLRCVVDPRLS